MQTEKEKFLIWYENEKKNGLLGCSLTLNHENNPTEEDVYRELNEIVRLWESGEYERITSNDI